MRSIAVFSRIKRALGYVWESSRVWTLLSLPLLLAQSLLPILVIYCVKLLLEVAAASAGGAPKGPLVARAVLLLAVTGGAALVNVLVDAAATYVGEQQAEAVTAHMQELVHTKAVEMDLEFYENSEFHNALHRAQQEAPHRPTQILRRLTGLAQSGITLVVLLAMLLTIRSEIAGIFLVCALPAILVRMSYARRLHAWRKRLTLPERHAGYLNTLLTAPWGAKEVRLFELGPELIRRYGILRRELREGRRQLLRRRVLLEAVVECVAVLVVYGTFCYLVFLALWGAVSIGSLFLYYQVFQRAQAAIQAAISAVTGLYEDSLYLADLETFLALENRVLQPAEPQPFPAGAAGEIRFEGISFAYPGSSRKAVDDVSFAIRRGQVAALVGENGSGKTTLVKLLTRLYDPGAGRITLDGVDLRELSLDDLRQNVGVLFQDFMLYQLTARENIAFGDIRRADAAAIEAAARASGAEAFIQRLPAGLETRLGNWFPEGEELSVGQWQKIALARAFVRSAPVLILDEPSSALDPNAEFELTQQLQRLTRGKTALLITHRLSTIQMADVIFVMEGGRLVESGSHPQLLAQGGVYAAMYERQASGYATPG